MPRAVVLDRGIIKTSTRTKTGSCNIDVARSVNRDGITKIKVVARSAVAGHPLLLSGTVVLDRGIVVIRPCGTDARSRNIDIARSINCNGTRLVTVTRRPVVTGSPLLCPRSVVALRRAHQHLLVLEDDADAPSDERGSCGRLVALVVLRVALEGLDEEKGLELRHVNVRGLRAGVIVGEEMEVVLGRQEIAGEPLQDPAVLEPKLSPAPDVANSA